MSDSDYETTVLTAYKALELDKRPCLLMMAGSAIGQRYPLMLPETVMGRSVEVDIVLDDVKVSRQHAKVTLHENSAWIEDLGSTNKTYVNNRQIERSVLLDGDLISVGSTVMKYTYLSEVDAAFHEEVVDAARLDELTQLVNRRFFQRRLEAEFVRSCRYHKSLSLLVCDLDDFKQVNDNHGHAVGDRVLRLVSDTVQANLRKNVDLAGRYGGEELVVLLPETGIDGARQVAEKIRWAVAALADQLGSDMRIGVSIGVAELTDDMDSAERLFEIADARLYQAKADGKNRVQAD